MDNSSMLLNLFVFLNQSNNWSLVPTRGLFIIDFHCLRLGGVLMQTICPLLVFYTALGLGERTCMQRGLGAILLFAL